MYFKCVKGEFRIECNLEECLAFGFKCAAFGLCKVTWTLRMICSDFLQFY